MAGTATKLLLKEI